MNPLRNPDLPRGNFCSGAQLNLPAAWREGASVMLDGLAEH